MQKLIAKINLKAIADNARAFKALTDVKLCAVVKADAYGHGAEAVTGALSGIADMFAVSIVEEAKAIALAACGTDILVLTPPSDEDDLLSMAKNGFIATLPDLKTAKAAVKICQKHHLSLRVHLKVNTGMNRYGMNASLLGKVCKFLQGKSEISTEGVYSHLYTHSYDVSEKQRALFLAAERVCRRYFPSVISHLSATFGALLGEKYSFGMVRVGLGLYGYLPFPIDFALEEKISVTPAMKVYMRAVQSRKYSFGGAGYGTPTDEEKKKIAFVTVYRAGYADGFDRKKDDGLDGSEKNLACLCMDACVRKGRARAGTYAPLMTDAEKAAEQSGTISYEILCKATHRAEFIYEYE